MFIFLISIFFVSISAGDPLVHCYTTREGCEDKIEGDLIAGYPRDVELDCVGSNTAYSYSKCENKVSYTMFFCFDRECDSCTTEVSVGRCNGARFSLLGGTYYCYVKDCGIGGSATALYVFGSIFLVFGLIFALCCAWVLCCPLGCTLVFVGCCVANC